MRVDDLYLRNAYSPLLSRVQHEDLGMRGREEKTNYRNPMGVICSRASASLSPQALQSMEAHHGLWSEAKIDQKEVVRREL